jgi:hypothetical protein
LSPVVNNHRLRNKILAFLNIPPENIKRGENYSAFLKVCKMKEKWKGGWGVQIHLVNKIIDFTLNIVSVGK